MALEILFAAVLSHVRARGEDLLLVGAAAVSLLCFSVPAAQVAVSATDPSAVAILGTSAGLGDPGVSPSILHTLSATSHIVLHKTSSCPLILPPNCQAAGSVHQLLLEAVPPPVLFLAASPLLVHTEQTRLREEHHLLSAATVVEFQTSLVSSAQCFDPDKRPLFRKRLLQAGRPPGQCHTGRTALLQRAMETRHQLLPQTAGAECRHTAVHTPAGAVIPVAADTGRSVGQPVLVDNRTGSS